MRMQGSIQLKISIKKLLLFWMLWYLLITPIILYWLPLPKFIQYFGDVIGCLVFAVLARDFFVRRKKTFVGTANGLWITLFLVGGTFSAIVGAVSPVCFLWGIRNCGRFFLFFCAASMYLDIKDFMKTRKIIRAIFWISLPLCFYETYFITYSSDTIIGDMVGGIYHGFDGVSAPLNVILILVCADVLSEFFQNRVKLTRLFLTLTSAVVMSALAELKIFIVELVIILLVNMIISKKSFKTIFVAAVGVILLTYTISFFIYVNARGKSTYGDVFTVEGFVEYITRDSGYDGVGDLNRLSGIATLNDGIFEGNLFQHLFGIGIGGGEYTGFFTSAFYDKYSSLHYQWFQMIWTYVENGYLGIAAMFGILLTQLKKAFQLKERWLKNYVCTMMILIPVLFVYNASLRSEVTGFYLYFILALPCIARKKEAQQNRLQEENG